LDATEREGIDRQPGLTGRVPFRWACRRSGRCCRVGQGYVWLGEGEEERLAGALGAAPEAFRRLHVRALLDPGTGAWRRALREREDGRCVLLEGGNECSVYAARPEHCRRFPFWDGVLAGGAGFERAREVCPGIEPMAPGAPEASGGAGGAP
jgi:Fe-S-cluster containining protein